MPSASGTVYRYGTNQTIVNASVKAVKESKVVHQTTDEYGDFTFEDLEAGKWDLVAVDETSLRGKPVQIDLVDNETGIIIELSRCLFSRACRAARGCLPGSPPSHSPAGA